MFAKLVDFVRSNKLTVSSSLRFLGSGGAPIDKNLKKDVNSIFHCDLQNGYAFKSDDYTNDNDDTKRIQLYNAKNALKEFGIIQLNCEQAEEILHLRSYDTI